MIVHDPKKVWTWLVSYGEVCDLDNDEDEFDSNDDDSLIFTKRNTRVFQ